jgi:hypothetical protein
MDLRTSIDRRRLVTALAVLRTGLGVVAFVAPALPARPWVGRDAERPAVRTVARALGGRDLALGLGTLVAAGTGAPDRAWLAASALSDAGDVVATLEGWARRPRLGRLAVLVAATGGAIACAALAVAPTSS